MTLDIAGGTMPDGVVLGVMKNFPALLSRKPDGKVVNYGYHPDCGWFAAMPAAHTSVVEEVVRTLMPAADHGGDGYIESSGGVKAVCNPITCTLTGSNQLLHPSVLGGYLGPAPGNTFDAAPSFYRGNPPATFTIMAQLWAESALLAKAVEREVGLKGLFDNFGNTQVVRGMVSLGATDWPLFLQEWLCWGAFWVSSRLRGAVLPTLPAAEAGKLRFNTGSRAIVDDLGYGLCVLLGIAAIVGQPMPKTAAVVAEQQVYLNKEFVVFRDGQLVHEGRHVASDTSAPQAYGVRTLAELRDLVLHQRMPAKPRASLGCPLSRGRASELRDLVLHQRMPAKPRASL